MSALNSLAYDDLGSAAQRERRKRILDATIALASKGGFDAVQMRAVAEKADVALGTLYRYFPSKIHLLVSGLAREFERAQEKLERQAIPGDTPAAAEVEQVGRLMENMFAKAMGIAEPTEADRDIFHVVADVWMANLVAWVTRRASAADVANRLELSVHLLLDK